VLTERAGSARGVGRVGGTRGRPVKSASGGELAGVRSLDWLAGWLTGGGGKGKQVTAGSVDGSFFVR
jgi:hypothetical protein